VIDSLSAAAVGAAQTFASATRMLNADNVAAAQWVIAPGWQARVAVFFSRVAAARFLRGATLSAFNIRVALAMSAQRPPPLRQRVVTAGATGIACRTRSSPAPAAALRGCERDEHPQRVRRGRAENTAHRFAQHEQQQNAALDASVATRRPCSGSVIVEFLDQPSQFGNLFPAEFLSRGKLRDHRHDTPVEQAVEQALAFRVHIVGTLEQRPVR